MRNFIFALFFVVSVNSLSAEAISEDSYIERRAAIDVGSGSTKITVADVDTETNAILAILFEDTFSVPYQANLEISYEGSFDESIRLEGLKTFYEIQDLTKNLGVQKISAVATAAFREAINGEEFAAEVRRETNIPLQIIDQHEEGKLAFMSGAAVSDVDEQNVVVWDIGTGSFQFTTLTESGNIVVFMDSYGAVPFKNYIIEVVEELDINSVTTPNPMTIDHIKDADSFARFLGRQAQPIFKNKLNEKETVVIGIGRLFSASIGPLGENNIINRDDLRLYIRASEGLSDEEMDNPFASSDVSNAILVLGFMKALHIQEIKIAETKSTHGILLNKDYWK
ncbi:MAG: hypothetical protein VX777_02745 [Chlamydiota bacterium]|nr:hypothetical protein [Chlamydiota bacterium]